MRITPKQLYRDRQQYDPESFAEDAEAGCT